LFNGASYYRDRKRALLRFSCAASAADVLLAALLQMGVPAAVLVALLRLEIFNTTQSWHWQKGIQGRKLS
jgi:hypothetical protein